MLALPGLEARLGARWDVVDDARWTVIFENIAFYVLGLCLSKKDLNQKGTWRMTFLDEDLRILWSVSIHPFYFFRASGGKAENLYILGRVPDRR